MTSGCGRAMTSQSMTLPTSAAAEAGRVEAARVGRVKLCEVIARPHEDVMTFLKTG